MKMELIQPFINATDAVLAETLQCPTKMNEVSMEEEAHRRQGLAAITVIRGEIEGQVILDIEPVAAVKAASTLAGGPVEESDELVRETVCELTNMIIGNAVTLLNDQGCHFRVEPPVVRTTEEGLAANQDTEALVISFSTPHGQAFLNIALRRNRRRRRDNAPAAVA